LAASRPRIALLALLLLWLAAAVMPLAEQFLQGSQMRAVLAGKSAAERTAYFDNPAFQAAQEIAQAVPADGCVVILAYAGPDAVQYYQARFRYLLYPREVHVFADASASVEGCGHLAVFYDSPEHLGQSPFSGTWDTQALSQRLKSLRRLLVTDAVDIYALP
jgi:hypothetical protein